MPTEQTSGQTKSGADALYNDVQRYIELPTRVAPQQAVEAVMCTLAERLARGEARDVVESLPPSVRPLLVRCAIQERGEPGETFDREELLRRVSDRLNVDPGVAAPIIRAVFAAVRERMPAHEAQDVASQLPRDICTIWEQPKAGL